MMRLRAKIFGALAAVLLAAAAAEAQTVPVTVVEETILTPSPEFASSIANARSHKETHHHKSPSFRKGSGGSGHFTWGADAGSSIDMSATDMR